MKPYHLFIIAFLFVVALSWVKSDFVSETYDIDWPIEVLQEMKRE